MTAEATAIELFDDDAARRRIDVSDLLARITSLPEQCETAWREASAFDWPAHAARARNVVVLGMGGSAIAGDLLRSLALAESDKPITVVRGEAAPAFVAADSLVVACSHSGNTEETLSAFEAALAKGACCTVVTTGGRLGDLAMQKSVPAFLYQYDGPPRCALGYQLMALLALGRRAGLLDGVSGAVEGAIAQMRKRRDALAFEMPLARNPAKQLAGRARGKVPVVIGGGALAVAAHRWKTQVNENAKSWAIWDELPEIDHNSVVGFGLPKSFVAQLHALFLLPEKLSEGERTRYEATAAELERAGVAHERVDVSGDQALTQVLDAFYLGDFVSYYLALLNGVDPTPIDPIARVKARLAQG